MCGRGIRTSPRKEFCNIVQSSNTNYLFEKVGPALVFNVANCTSKSSRQIALIMLFQMLHLHQVENGREPAKDQYYYSELLNLGYHASENGYDRGSAVHEIFQAVDADYPNLNHGFCCARNHACGLARKGDREYLLSQQ